MPLPNAAAVNAQNTPTTADTRRSVRRRRLRRSSNREYPAVSSLPTSSSSWGSSATGASRDDRTCEPAQAAHHAKPSGELAAAEAPCHSCVRQLLYHVQLDRLALAGRKIGKRERELRPHLVCERPLLDSIELVVTANLDAEPLSCARLDSFLLDVTPKQILRDPVQPRRSRPVGAVAEPRHAHRGLCERLGRQLHSDSRWRSCDEPGVDRAGVPTVELGERLRIGAGLVDQLCVALHRRRFRRTPPRAFRQGWY